MIAGNWKMHHNHLEAIQVVQKLSYRLDTKDYDSVEVVGVPAVHRAALGADHDRRRPHRRSRSARRTATGRRGRVHRRGQPADAGQAQRAVRDRRPLGAARAASARPTRSVAKKVRAVLAAEMTADPVRRRDARGARGGRHRRQGRRSGRGRVRGAVRPTTAAALRRRVRADLGDRHRPQRHARRRQRHDRRRSASTLREIVGATAADGSGSCTAGA